MRIILRQVEDDVFSLCLLGSHFFFFATMAKTNDVEPPHGEWHTQNALANT